MRFQWRSQESYFENIRIKKGEKNCLSAFRRSCEIDRKSAIEQLNHPELSYVTFYLLLGHIREKALYPYLTPRNLTALLVTNQIINKDQLAQRVNYLIASGEEMQSVLQYMFLTGYTEQEPDEDYRRVIDVVATVCARTLPDEHLLALIVKLIFQRHQQGQSIKRLIAALFDESIPKKRAQRQIAPYLCSPQESERQLAHWLLTNSSYA